MCHSGEGKSQSVEGRDWPFLCAPYVTGEEGRPRPVEGIGRCPLAAVGETCKLTRHSFRDRKTGPRFALRILHCATHRRHFTVYPSGHVPYGREAVAPVDERGQIVVPEEEAACWQATIFCRSAGCGDRRALAA